MYDDFNLLASCKIITTNFACFNGFQHTKIHSASEHGVDALKIILQQSGTGRKTFQAKSMPFWKEKSSNLTISLWMDFPSN